MLKISLMIDWNIGFVITYYFVQSSRSELTPISWIFPCLPQIEAEVVLLSNSMLWSFQYAAAAKELSPWYGNAVLQVLLKSV